METLFVLAVIIIVFITIIIKKETVAPVEIVVEAVETVEAAVVADITPVEETVTETVAVDYSNVKVMLHDSHVYAEIKFSKDQENIEYTYNTKYRYDNECDMWEVSRLRSEAYEIKLQIEARKKFLCIKEEQKLKRLKLQDEIRRLKEELESL